MHKYIGGRHYNTETAKFCGEYEYSNPRDFHYIHEILYQKKNGEFFLYGIGGAMTKYSETVGQNEWSGGRRITPFSVDEAKEWAEEHLDGDEYESIFGKTDDDDETYDEKTVTSFSLPVKTIMDMKNLAKQRQCNMSDVIVSLVTKCVNETKIQAEA